eukprot:6178157-Pleurochrysis_carterae.AAC.3
MERKRHRPLVFGPGVRRSSRIASKENQHVSIPAKAVAEAKEAVRHASSKEAAALNWNMCIKALFLRKKTGTQPLKFPLHEC